MLTYGSLFSGMGGFDLGFDRAGMRCVWQVERDRQCLELLAAKWPNIRRINDIMRARYAMEPKYVGRMDTTALVRPDVICGGFPCQDLSVAGKRAGLAGNRSGLFWTMRRIIGIQKPTWIVLENVPGLLSSNRGRDMGAILGALGDIGYGVAYRVLDSQFFGLPQRRKRVFIVGYFGDVRRAAQVLFEPNSVRRDTPPSRQAREEIAGTLEARTDGGGFPGSDGAMSGHVVTASIESNGDAHSGFRDADGLVAFAQNTRDEVREIGGNIAGALPSQPGMKQQTYVAMCLNAKNGKRYDAESETLISEEYTPTLQAANNGSTAVPSIQSRTHGVRRLTPLECERLQGFPDSWTAGFSDSARYRMIGNAVSVPVIKWIAKRLIKA